MSATTKERPILFSAPMVRAILDGRKTQTRRVVKPQPPYDMELSVGGYCPPVVGRNGIEQPGDEVYGVCDIFGEWSCRCLYGKPGDRLWLREEHFRFGHWARVPDVTTRTGRSKWQFVGDSDEVLFEQPRELCRSMNAPYFDRPGWYKRVARYMPRWASRIDLEITGVRVERLQEISPEDAIAEGCCPSQGSGFDDADTLRRAAEIVGGPYPRGVFADLWQSINGPDSWAANPWVWVIEFRRIGGAS